MRLRPIEHLENHRPKCTHKKDSLHVFLYFTELLSTDRTNGFFQNQTELNPRFSQNWTKTKLAKSILHIPNAGTFELRRTQTERFCRTFIPYPTFSLTISSRLTFHIYWLIYWLLSQDISCFSAFYRSSFILCTIQTLVAISIKNIIILYIFKPS